MDKRNVTDYYKLWDEEAIKADLRTKHHKFSVLVTNLIRDFNLGSVIRNANAFCATEVIVYGRKQYDRRGTVGTHRYMDLKHVRFAEDLDFTDKIVVGVDNLPSAMPVENFVWPKDQHVIMAFGEEGTGLPPEILKFCNHLVYITQYGSVRSINVACASAIAMYDYCNKTLNKA